jgi:hypothetical protein
MYATQLHFRKESAWGYPLARVTFITTAVQRSLMKRCDQDLGFSLGIIKKIRNTLRVVDVVEQLGQPASKSNVGLEVLSGLRSPLGNLLTAHL